MIRQLRSLTFNQHLQISLVIRCLLIVYGHFQDTNSEVKYTDIDYVVVTDGARHLLAGGSPYARHTYRYSPLLAALCTPNILWHPAAGKLLFVLADLLVAVLIRCLVRLEYRDTLRSLIGANIRSGRFAHVQQPRLGRARRWEQRHGPAAETAEIRGGSRLPQLQRLPQKYEDRAVWSACTWLYNPFTMVVATRGNGDALTAALVLGALYVMMRAVQQPDEEADEATENAEPELAPPSAGSFGQCLLAGVLHGLSIHMRIYPLIFSVAYYLFCADRGKRRGWLATLVQPPNRQQLGLVLGTVATIAALTAAFYALYGPQFLHETYLHHLGRRDHRHNFSLFFYMQYLQAGQSIAALQSVLQLAPQLLILGTVTVQMSRSRKTLPFAVFLLVFVMVTFNSVLTSQYFVWYMAVAPVCAANFAARWTRRSAAVYAVLWLSTQALWLLTAYLLEFKGWNTFHLVWMHGAVFFGANVLLVLRLVRQFVPKTM